jgi:RHS repeat-associated protein
LFAPRNTTLGRFCFFAYSCILRSIGSFSLLLLLSAALPRDLRAVCSVDVLHAVANGRILGDSPVPPIGPSVQGGLFITNVPPSGLPPGTQTYIDGGISASAGSCVVGMLNFSSAYWRCDYSALPTGPHTNSIGVSLASYDASNNSKVEDCSAGNLTESFYVDRDVPIVTVQHPLALTNTVVSASDTFHGSADDGIMLCTIGSSMTWTDSEGQVHLLPPMTPNTNPALVSDIIYHPGFATTQWDVPLKNLWGSTITIHAFASDCAGHMSNDEARTFYVDGKPPLISFTTMSSVEVNGVFRPIVGSSTDDYGIQKVELSIFDTKEHKYWNGADFVDAETKIALPGIAGKEADWSYTISGATVPKDGGEWIVRVEATDLVGNVNAAVGHMIFLKQQTLSNLKSIEGDPRCTGGVNLAEGELNQYSVMLWLAEGSPALRMSASHNSQGAQDSRWGYGWVTEHDQTLYANPGGSVTWADGTGGRLVYFVSGQGTGGLPLYVRPINTYTSLLAQQMDSDGMPSRFLLSEKDGTSIRFDRLGVQNIFLPALLTDRNGSTLNYERDANGRLLKLTDIHGRYLTFSYGTNGRISVVRDSTGRSTSYTYDAQGNRVSETDPNGDMTGYAYDSAHRLTQVTFPSGGKRTYTYDVEGRVLSQSDDGGEHLQTYAYHASSTVLTDALGRQTVYEWKSRGGLKQPVRIEDPAGGVSAFGYDPNMNAVLQNDARNNPTHYEFDGNGNVTKAYDVLNHSVQLTYETAFNQPRTIKDAREHTTTLNYDPTNGNLSEVVDALGNATQMVYDAQGHTKQINNAAHGSTLFDYNSNGALISVTDSLQRTTQLQRDELSRLVANVDPAGKRTEFSYDAMGNLTEVKDALNGLTRYAYDPGREARLLKTVTDAKNHATGFGYDAAGRLNTVTNALGQSKSFSYDKQGNLKTVFDAKEQTISFEYDPLDRLISKTLPGTPALSYEYDAVGNLKRVSHPNGSVVAMTYDPANRVSETVQTLPGGHTVLLGYDYDANGNRILMASPWLTLNYTYDELDRLKTITDQLNRQTLFDYDALGRRTHMTLPNGTRTDYAYDAAGQLLSVTHLRVSDNSVLASVTYTYDAAGNRNTMTDAAGEHVFTYDNLHRLTGANHPAASNLATKAETFAYDAVGNRTADAVRTGYQYDAANRITQDSEYEYAHDDNGNLTGATGKLSHQTTTYAYDAENQLTQVTLPDGTVWNYKYDGLGRRIEKSSGTLASQIVRYVYDNEDILAMLDGDNQFLAVFLHGPGIDEPLGIAKADGSQYLMHADGLGSIIAHSDINGNLVERVEYEAYGKPVFIDLRGTPTTSGQSFTGSLYAFTAREWDEERGQYDFRYRQGYDPRIGRFGQEDPIGLANGNMNLYVHARRGNLYEYVSNSPGNYTDPLGLMPLDLPPGWGDIRNRYPVILFYGPKQANPCGPGGEGPEFLQTHGGKDFRQCCGGHDPCYLDGDPGGRTRQSCDDEFYRCMQNTAGMNRVAQSWATLYYRSVRMGGRFYYNYGYVKPVCRESSPYSIQ